MSEAVKDETEIESDVDVDGILKPVTDGLVVSGNVITTCLLTLVETLPEASFAQAYRVFVPCVVKVYEVGTEEVHDPLTGLGTFDDSVKRYPVIPMLSVAVSVEIATVREVDVVGIVKDEITGKTVSETTIF